ncbi:amino acid--tRNA ligase-related protein [Candidatus Vidania fulgoroideorum]
MKFSNLNNAIKKKINHLVKIKGRVLAKRVFKSIIFIKIIDGVFENQIIFKKGEIEKAKRIKLGDIIISKCKVFINENKVKCFKSINTKLVVSNNIYLPDKKKNIKNKKEYYKKSYIRIATNLCEKKKIFRRFKVIEKIRGYMKSKKFLEIETPILSEITEGSDSKPFITEHISLRKNMFLRISPELNLKKMLISGFENIFEIGKNFRNEGISKKHYPEFLNIEFYKTFKNYKWGMTFLEKMLKYIAKYYKNKNIINENIKNILKKFDVLTIEESILKYSNIKKEDLENKDIFIKKFRNSKYKKYDLEKIKFLFFEKKVTKKIKVPTFVTNYPIFSSPLAKKKKKKPYLERFELYISGIEIANGFSELNDFIEQRERFKTQENLNKKKINSNFIESMKFGMPPACGCGLGIDRLIMILECAKNIKDILILPELK